MNFKQMYLLEALIDSFSKGTLRIEFMMDGVTCFGDFRNKGNDVEDVEDSENDLVKIQTVDQVRLLLDYLVFHEEYKEYFDELNDHLVENENYQNQKLLNAMFVDWLDFIMENEEDLDKYLTTDDIPFVIHKLQRFDKYHEEYAVGEDTSFTPVTVHIVQEFTKK